MQNPIAFNNIYKHFYAQQSYGKLAWSEQLSMAARHYLNDKAACLTSGDKNGNSFEEVLSKYYAYSATGIMYSIIEFPEFTDYLDAGRGFMEYILTMNDIDKSLFTQDDALFVGIACSCAHEEEIAGIIEQKHTCMFAFAQDIRQKKITQYIPEYAEIISVGDQCKASCEQNEIKYAFTDC